MVGSVGGRRSLFFSLFDENKIYIYIFIKKKNYYKKNLRARPRRKQMNCVVKSINLDLID